MILQASSGPAHIEFTDAEPSGIYRGCEYYRVTFAAHGLQATTRVNAFDPLDEGLPIFFDQLVSALGHEATHHWSSLEGEFELKGKSDQLGHVHIEATLSSTSHEAVWTVIERLTLDAASVERAAAEIKQFCSIL